MRAENIFVHIREIKRKGCDFHVRAAHTAMQGKAR